MNMWFRLERSERAWIIFLGGLILLLLLATIGIRAWVSVNNSIASSRSIFDQSPDDSSASQPLSAQNLSRLHLLWSYTFAPDAPGRVVVVNGIVYVAAWSKPDYVLAIQNGKQLWRYQTPDPAQNLTDFQAGGDAVYLAMTTSTAPYTDNTIYALSARTGQELWRYHSATFLSHLIYSHSLLYFSTLREIYALDARTGKLQWNYQFTDGSPYSPFLFSDPSSLVAATGNLYLALWTRPYRAGTALLALDGRTGKVQWQLQEVGAKTFSLLVKNGVLYRRSDIQNVSAFDANTGKTLWRIALNLPPSSSRYGMDADQNLLYLDEEGRLQAFDVNTGHLVWSSQQLEGRGFFIGPIVGNGVVYVGTEIPYTAYGHPFFGPPIRAPHWLYTFDAQSGKLIRMLQDNDSSFEPKVLALDNEHLYVSGSRSFLGADDTAEGMPELYALGV